MGLPPPERASGAPSAKGKPPSSARLRVRSESDRKKHAGWRQCPRCNRSVSTNGRNFYHHMHKCDRVFFADLIARFDAARSSKPAPPPPLPPAAPPPASVPASLSPTTPPPHAPAYPSPSASTPLTPAGSRLSEMQRAVFLQQLCFLRIYDRTVDAVFRQLESSRTRVFAASIFEAVRQAKSRQKAGSVPYTPPYSPPAAALPPRSFAPVPLPDVITSPLTVPAASPFHVQSPESKRSRPLSAPPAFPPHAPSLDIPRHRTDIPHQERYSVSECHPASAAVSSHFSVQSGIPLSTPASSSAQIHAVPLHSVEERPFSQVVPVSGGYAQTQPQPMPVSSKPASAMSISSVINN